MRMWWELVGHPVGFDAFAPVLGQFGKGVYKTVYIFIDRVLE